MTGLLRNNLYATLSNAKVFSLIMLLLGAFVVAMDNKINSLIIAYMLLSMVGFPLNSVASLRKEHSGKWSRYKLSLPVRRAAVIVSYYISLLTWLLVGMLFAAACTALSISLHGFPFDRETDIFMLFVVGIGLSLFMGATFFPLFHLSGEERNEVFLVLSLLCATGLILGFTSLINTVFPAPMSTAQTLLGGLILLALALLIYSLSCPLTVFIYRRREY